MSKQRASTSVGSTDSEHSSQVATGAKLPILGTIACVLIFIVTVFPALVSPMLFDSGVSGASYAIFFGLWATLLLCLISISGGWIFWAFTRHKYGKLVRLSRVVIFLLPLLSLGVVAAGFIWITTVCSGYLAC